ncbi:hypothetical protein JMJ77_0002578 [Colletotrichum scovillei]|uniref:Uncharacterized protein n=1 Tax=Colletotrichum scovillei TaxID=1209932 RepID=A0A9P7R9W7_9PEZI|nr:hypothetical protein JMJ77_0002578 [Colletotrichum scovillei]KAG7071001.1 hypothetical protein JMJ76_0002241 [Colletotrichum scovillei]KAG7079247.1 hypothetical protein JMJ78_0002903 [Colletotrichum scovillei]
MPTIPQPKAGRDRDGVLEDAAHGWVTKFLTERQVEEPSGPLPPVSPVPPGSQVQCSGWGCLSEAQQAGVLVTIVVVFLSLFLGLMFFLRSKKKQDSWVDGDLILVRTRRRPRPRSQAASINSQYSRFFFRHEGLTGTQQPPQVLIAHPTILHIPPPPPLPVPVPLPLPMPMPMPFRPPQPIYPYLMAYQANRANQYHPMRAQAFGNSQEPSAVPAFPINAQYQQQPQPYPQAQQHPQYQWNQGPGLQQSEQRSQQPPRRRPSLARRLFSLFNNPVGRASTIASSDSDSTRAPSIRSSHHSRTSATSVATPPSPDVRMKRTATHGADAIRPLEVSPAVATVQSDDYVTPTTMQDALPVPANSGGEAQYESREKAVITESPVKKHVQAERDNTKTYPTSIPISEDTETAGTHPSRPVAKPLKSALKNGNKAAAGARLGNTNKDKKLSAKEDSVHVDFASSRTITSPMAAEASSSKGKEEQQQGKSVDKRSPKENAVCEVTRDHPDGLGTAIHSAEALKKPVPDPQSSPVKSTENKHDQSSSPNQHSRRLSSRTAELRFDVSCSDVTETSDSLSDDSPPPSPPRPIHQGGGKYAPEQLRWMPSRRAY